MSAISIERQHTLGSEEARQRVARIESKLKERYGVNLAWSGNRAEVVGKGVKGNVQVEHCRVVIDLKLGLLLKPLAGKIREAMERSVDRALG